VEQKGSDERKQQNDNDAEFAAQDDPQNFTEVDFIDFGLLTGEVPRWISAVTGGSGSL